jgi:hypothetical protein
MPFPPPETAKPAIVKAAEEPSLQVPSAILERREQRLLRASFNELLAKSEQAYSEARAFQGSEEQLALSLTFLLATTENGKRVPNSRLDVVEKFSPLSRDEILAKALQQDASEEIAKLQKRRDELTGKDKITDLERSIEFLEEELSPQREHQQRLASSIERILNDPAVARELKTPEEKLEAVTHLHKRLTPLNEQISEVECLLAMRKHELLEAHEDSKQLTRNNENLLAPIDKQLAAVRQRGRATEGLSIRDILRPSHTNEFLRSYAKSETPAFMIREARNEHGEVSVASFGFASPVLGESARQVFLFDKTGIELSYHNGQYHYVEHGSPRVIIQEPDFSAFETPSSQTNPQSDLALLTRPPSATERKRALLGQDDVEIHAANGALITVGDLRYLTVPVFGSPIIDMAGTRTNEEVNLSLTLERGTGSHPLILRYNRFPAVSVDRPFLKNKVGVSLRKERLSLEGVHSLPIELHVQIGQNKVVKVTLTRPGAENAEFNSERAIRARIKAAAELDR